MNSEASGEAAFDAAYRQIRSTSMLLFVVMHEYKTRACQCPHAVDLHTQPRTFSVKLAFLVNRLQLFYNCI